MVSCEACNTAVPSYETVSVGSGAPSYRQLCSRCFNAEVAQLYGLENFENFRLDKVVLTDFANRPHAFHFRTHLLGTMVSLEAFEVKRGVPAGYQFQILGDPDEEILSLLGRLIERMRRRLSLRHLKKGKYGLQIAGRTVRGQIEWDEESAGRKPTLVIDGREVSWDQFGSMLMTFEGSPFRLELADRSEEV